MDVAFVPYIADWLSEDESRYYIVFTIAALFIGLTLRWLFTPSRPVPAPKGAVPCRRGVSLREKPAVAVPLNGDSEPAEERLRRRVRDLEDEKTRLETLLRGREAQGATATRADNESAECEQPARQHQQQLQQLRQRHQDSLRAARDFHDEALKKEKEACLAARSTLEQEKAQAIADKQQALKERDEFHTTACAAKLQAERAEKEYERLKDMLKSQAETEKADLKKQKEAIDILKTRESEHFGLEKALDEATQKIVGLEKEGYELYREHTFVRLLVQAINRRLHELSIAVGWQPDAADLSRFANEIADLLDSITANEFGDDARLMKDHLVEIGVDQASIIARAQTLLQQINGTGNAPQPAIHASKKAAQGPKSTGNKKAAKAASKTTSQSKASKSNNMNANNVQPQTKAQKQPTNNASNNESAEPTPEPEEQSTSAEQPLEPTTEPSVDESENSPEQPEKEANATRSPAPNQDGDAASESSRETESTSSEEDREKAGNAFDAMIAASRAAKNAQPAATQAGADATEESGPESTDEVEADAADSTPETQSQPSEPTPEPTLEGDKSNEASPDNGLLQQMFDQLRAKQSTQLEAGLKSDSKTENDTPAEAATTTTATKESEKPKVTPGTMRPEAATKATTEEELQRPETTTEPASKKTVGVEKTSHTGDTKAIQPQVQAETTSESVHEPLEKKVITEPTDDKLNTSKAEEKPQDKSTPETKPAENTTEKESEKSKSTSQPAAKKVEDAEPSQGNGMRASMWADSNTSTAEDRDAQIESKAKAPEIETTPTTGSRPNNSVPPTNVARSSSTSPKRNVSQQPETTSKEPKIPTASNGSGLSSSIWSDDNAVGDSEAQSSTRRGRSQTPRPAPAPRAESKQNNAAPGRAASSNATRGSPTGGNARGGQEQRGQGRGNNHSSTRGRSVSQGHRPQGPKQDGKFERMDSQSPAEKEHVQAKATVVDTETTPSAASQLEDSAPMDVNRHDAIDAMNIEAAAPVASQQEGSAQQQSDQRDAEAAMGVGKGKKAADHHVQENLDNIRAGRDAEAEEAMDIQPVESQKPLPLLHDEKSELALPDPAEMDTTTTWPGGFSPPLPSPPDSDEKDDSTMDDSSRLDERLKNDTDFATNVDDSEDDEDRMGDLDMINDQVDNERALSGSNDALNAGEEDPDFVERGDSAMDDFEMLEERLNNDAEFAMKVDALEDDDDDEDYSPLDDLEMLDERLNNDAEFAKKVDALEDDDDDDEEHSPLDDFDMLDEKLDTDAGLVDSNGARIGDDGDQGTQTHKGIVGVQHNSPPTLNNFPSSPAPSEEARRPASPAPSSGLSDPPEDDMDDDYDLFGELYPEDRDTKPKTEGSEDHDDDMDFEDVPGARVDGPSTSPDDIEDISTIVDQLRAKQPSQQPFDPDDQPLRPKRKPGTDAPGATTMGASANKLKQKALSQFQNCGKCGGIYGQHTASCSTIPKNPSPSPQPDPFEDFLDEKPPKDEFDLKRDYAYQDCGTCGAKRGDDHGLHCPKGRAEKIKYEGSDDEDGEDSSRSVDPEIEQRRQADEKKRAEELREARERRRLHEKKQARK